MGFRQDIDGEKCGLSSQDEAVLENIAKLLGLGSQAERLKEVLLIRQINVRGTITDIPLRMHEVTEIAYAGFTSQLTASDCLSGLRKQTRNGPDPLLAHLLLAVAPHQRLHESGQRFESRARHPRHFRLRELREELVRTAVHQLREREVAQVLQQLRVRARTGAVLVGGHRILAHSAQRQLALRGVDRKAARVHPETFIGTMPHAERM